MKKSVLYQALFLWIIITLIHDGAAVESAHKPLFLIIGKQKLQIEIANTPALRERGLMFRKTLADDHGMLFVFPHAKPYCFWMKNTYVPLTLLFIDDAGIIQNIYDMQPKTLTPRCANVPVRYALEVNQGWQTHRQLQAAKKIHGLIPLFAY